MYQNQLMHITIGIMYDVPCTGRSKAPRRHSVTSVHWVQRASCTDWSSWPLHASDLTTHARSIMLKYFNTSLCHELQHNGIEELWNCTHLCKWKPGIEYYRSNRHKCCRIISYTVTSLSINGIFSLILQCLSTRISSTSAWNRSL